MQNNYTRLRAYHVERGGLSFSYSVDMEFILVGGRYGNSNASSIKEDMRIAGCDTIDVLHIPSWDVRCCQPEELKRLLEELQPAVLEIPGYKAIDERAKECENILWEYSKKTPFADIMVCSPHLISHMTDDDSERKWLSPKSVYSNLIDNDAVICFRQGRFSVINTGYIESIGVVEHIVKEIKPFQLGVLVIDGGIKESPFISHQFLDIASPMMLIDVANGNKFYMRGDLTSETLGVSIKRNENGDIIITAGIRPGEIDIETSEVTEVEGHKYDKE